MKTSIARVQPTNCFVARNQPSRHCSRTSSVAVRAEDPGFCRDKVAIPSGASTATVEGETTLVFLGAQGQRIELAAKKDTYILDSGLDAGLELPFTCRGGICGACVGRVVEGQVDQSDVPDLTFTVSEEEVADGMTLLCMSRPVSDTVVIETQSDWGYSLGVAEWQGATGHITGKQLEPLMGNKWEKFSIDDKSVDE